MSGDPEQEYFVDGMAGEIIIAITAVRHRPQLELHLQSDNAIVIELPDIVPFPSSLAFNLGYRSCARNLLASER
jgi:hypothetical protein